MAKALLYLKPSCTTCRNARSYLADVGLAVDERDINKLPPAREFLERHVDEERFLDFVSTRSPVFKTRALPKSKAEAINLMLEQPNLIKRPILIKGSKVVFGFDRKQYDRLAGSA